MITSLVCHTLHLYPFKPDLLKDLGEIQKLDGGGDLRVVSPHLMKVGSSFSLQHFKKDTKTAK